MKRRQALLVLGSAIGAAAPAFAQDNWPNRPVRILVGFPAGTSSDVIARLFAQHLTDHFKQPFIIDNRPGAGGTLAAQAAANAPPDGYTLLLGGTGYSASQSIYPNLTWDFGADFKPVARLASAPLVVVVSASSNISNVGELLAAVRKTPGAFTFGSSGIGAAPHLAGELFAMMVGTRMLHVPYKGSSQALIDVADGRLGVVFTPAPTLAGFRQDKRVNLLAVTTGRRSTLLPELPTLAEAGVPGYDVSIWYGFMAPKGTPDGVVNALADVLLRVTEHADVRAALKSAGAEPYTAGPQETARFIAEDMQKWSRVVKFANVKLE